MSGALESRPFVLAELDDPLRVVRGSIELPAGAASGPRALAFVLVLHGFKGFKDWGFFPEVARRLARRGLAAVRFDFSGSGVGEDAGTLDADDAFFANTPSRELEDVERVRAYLTTLPWIDATRGGLFGHSLGGAVALLHAARDGCRALVLWAPVAHFQRFGPEVAARWRADGFLEIPNARTGQIHRLGVGWLEDLEKNGVELDVAAACARLSTPALIVHGSSDEAVPLAEGLALARSFPRGAAELAVLAGAGHTFGAVHPLRRVPPDLEQVLERTERFFESHLLVR